MPLPAASSLAGFRALDLSDEKGQLCGKMLADAGVDVIKIERPGGDPSRNAGPFYHDIVDPEKSLAWFALNTGKRGITLNIETADGRALLKRLVQSADFLIESFAPGYLRKLGLDYKRLSRLNPRLIMVSISGFGQTGPYSRYKAPDIVAMAAGGEMYLVGEPNRPPLRVGIPQAYSHASGEGAVAAMVALWHRENTGEGQYADVSAQECVTWEGFQNQSMWDMEKKNLRREGVRRQFGRAMFRYLFPCKDGHISYLMLGGLLGADSGRKLVAWITAEGMADDYLKAFDWDAFDPARFTTEEGLRLEKRLGAFFAVKTKDELFTVARERGIFLAPVLSPKDQVEDVHFAARKYWVKIRHEEIGDSITYPGSAYRSTETPYVVRGRAPLIGEHNRDIYEGELGLSAGRLAMLKGAGSI